MDVITQNIVTTRRIGVKLIIKNNWRISWNDLLEIILEKITGGRSVGLLEEESPKEFPEGSLHASLKV